MTEQEWPQIEAALKGLWPRRTLPAASMYLRLLSPFSAQQVQAALDQLAQRIAYAPSPSEILQALRPAPAGGSSAERERAYGEQIAAWLCSKLPELCDDGTPHPAAIAAVIRLHHAHGKRRLTVAEHGPQIRAAVRAHEQRFAAKGEQ